MPRRAPAPSLLNPAFHIANSSAVLVAIVGLVGTWIQTRGNTSDLAASYKTTAEAVNHLQRQVTRLEGELSELKSVDGKPSARAPRVGEVREVCVPPASPPDAGDLLPVAVKSAVAEQKEGDKR